MDVNNLHHFIHDTWPALIDDVENVTMNCLENKKTPLYEAEIREFCKTRDTRQSFLAIVRQYFEKILNSVLPLVFTQNGLEKK